MTAINHNPLNGTHVNGDSSVGSKEFAPLVTPAWVPNDADGEPLVWLDAEPTSGAAPTRASLETELSELHTRHQNARARLDSLDEELRSVLASEVEASRARFAEMDQHFEAMIAAVREDAAQEIQRIRVSSHQRSDIVGAIEMGESVE
jgi:hypothetical protein